MHRALLRISSYSFHAKDFLCLSSRILFIKGPAGILFKLWTVLSGHICVETCAAAVSFISRHPVHTDTETHTHKRTHTHTHTSRSLTRTYKLESSTLLDACTRMNVHKPASHTRTCAGSGGSRGGGVADAFAQEMSRALEAGSAMQNLCLGRPWVRAGRCVFFCVRERALWSLYA
jgi:hypothetical protein